MSVHHPEGGEHPVAAAPGAVRLPRLHEVDIVRILTFACVIGVHVIGVTLSSDDVVLGALLALLHFTRLVFFALTTFVLLYGQLARPRPMSTFWPRRFLLVGVPYLVWSVIYIVAADVRSPPPTVLDGVLDGLFLIVTGNAWYHLYFLLVTMQVYLLVPALCWLVRRTRGRHGLLLAVSFGVQLVIAAVYSATSATGAAVIENVLVVSYEFFVVAGAVAADHAGELLDVVRRHRGTVALVSLAGGLLLLVVYLARVLGGTSPATAGEPMQPAMMLWGVCVALGFLAIGSVWAQRRTPGARLDRIVGRASDRSFGIFLSHPLALLALTSIGGGWLLTTVPNPWVSLLCYVVVIAAAFGFSDVVRRTAVSMPLTGRPREQLTR